ncbi:MAG TPA: superoxide dismutase family protein [Balneola sp.]|nr:superoxide dismutase [Balneola sp.]MAO77288.1 superoxide dismutase [Balneola sp.]MBF62998.1 superoxide dismutase [Balneola sp.]HAW80287.1 superoxide dismutase family protein [Balneola sp.]HBZ37968.1 superoxide dismutase family protein [Balneola sp.]|tara:strand:+ start:1902 stop:2441 length:540 start_codon:yes stop_codon:yes gene_type:complete
MKNLLTFLAFVLILNCTKTERIEVFKEFEGPQIQKAVAAIHPVGENKISGTVHFDKTESGTKITAQVMGLSEGEHGFHIHQYGDCSAPDGTSAGGHFDPENMQHNSRDAEKRHVGDMGNLVSEGKESTTTLNYVDNHIFLEEIIGRGIIIHAGEDDLTSQPSGDAGARIACGVIGVAQN